MIGKTSLSVALLFDGREEGVFLPDFPFQKQETKGKFDLECEGGDERSQRKSSMTQNQMYGAFSLPGYHQMIN